MPPYSQNLRIFGEMAILKDNGKKMKGKLKDRGLMAMFVVYVDNHANNVYRFINLKTKKIVMSRDVTWLGKLYGDLYDLNNVQNEQNMDKEQATDTYVEIDIEEEKVKKIPT